MIILVLILIVKFLGQREYMIISGWSKLDPRKDKVIYNSTNSVQKAYVFTSLLRYYK